MNYDIGNSNWGNYVITGLAILGIALGGAGLYVGLAGRGDENKISDRISELEQRVERLDGASEELNGQIRGLYNQTRTALQAIDDRFTSLQGSRASAPASSAPATTAGSAQAAAPSAATAKTYTIRPGDTLGKLAQSAGTTVAAIQKANPNLNPNRLKVGQVIQLP